jgi:hypothetical protein
VDGANDVGTRQHQDVAVAAQIARMIAETIAAEVRFGQLVALNHGAHRTVEDEDTRGERQRPERGARVAER